MRKRLPTTIWSLYRVRTTKMVSSTRKSLSFITCVFNQGLQNGVGVGIGNFLKLYVESFTFGTFCQARDRPSVSIVCTVYWLKYGEVSLWGGYPEFCHLFYADSTSCPTGKLGSLPPPVLRCFCYSWLSSLWLFICTAMSTEQRSVGFYGHTYHRYKNSINAM